MTTQNGIVYEVNGSGPVGLGSFLAEVDSLEQDTQYFYRGYAVNLGGEKWAPNIETFLAMDTTFNKYFGWNGSVVGCPRCGWGWLFRFLFRWCAPAPLD